MKSMTLLLLFVNLIKIIKGSNGQLNERSSSETVVKEKTIEKQVEKFENNEISINLTSKKEQGTLLNKKLDNDSFYDPVQFQGDAAAHVISPPYKKIEVEGVRDAEGIKLINLLKKTLKEGKFSQEGYIIDILILLYKSLRTDLILNKEHEETLALLGNELANGNPKNVRFKKTLKLLGEAIKHGKINEKDHHETLRFISKILETDKSTDEEAFELLANIIVHNVRPGLHHYERLGLEPVKRSEIEQLKEESLTNVVNQSRSKRHASKDKKKKKHKKGKKRKHGKKQKGVKLRKKRATNIESPTSKPNDKLTDLRSPSANINMMMGDDPNAYIEYNAPEDINTKTIIDNQRIFNSEIKNTHPPTLNINSDVANNNKENSENSKSRDDLNLETGIHIPNQILTRNNSRSVRTGSVTGNNFQDYNSEDVDVEPQKTDESRVIRSQNRIFLIFKVSRNR